MIQNSITEQRLLSVDFFTDFLSFLRYCSHTPIKKTATSNISRADIAALSDLFRNGARLKFMDEEKRWPVRTETEVPYLTQIKFIAEALYLTYNRKGELRLSKNGGAYLESLTLHQQYRAMVFAYWNKINWEYFTPRSTLHVYQQNLNYILDYLISRKNEWIDFTSFYRSLKDYFQTHTTQAYEHSDPDFDARLDVQYGVIERNFKLFGCVETEEAKDDFGITTIGRFRSTDIGLWIFTERLNEQK